MGSRHEPTSSGDSTVVLCSMDLEHERRGPLRGKLYRVREGCWSAQYYCDINPTLNPSGLSLKTRVWFYSSSISIALRMIG